METIETSNQKCPDVKHKALVGIHYKSDKEFKSPTVFEAEWPLLLYKCGDTVSFGTFNPGFESHLKSIVKEGLEVSGVSKIVITVCE